MLGAFRSCVGIDCYLLTSIDRFLALLTYDMFCTFGEEVEVIWKRKFSVPTFLYLAIRLCTWGYFVFGTSLTYIPTTITVSFLFFDHDNISKLKV